LGHAHRPAGLVDHDFDSEARECRHKHTHGRQRPVVHDRPGPVEHDGPNALESLGHAGWLLVVSSSITSSAIAKAVLAPVPLVITTRRTASEGRSINIRRSGAEA